MKTNFLVRLITGTAISSFFLITPATAIVLVEPVVKLADPNLPNQPIGIGLNPPNTLVFWNAPDISGQQNFLNDTGLNITNLSLVLLLDLDLVADDVIWGDVDGDGKIGISTLFTNFEVDNSFILGGLRAPLVNITGGTITNNQRFVFQFLTNPDLTIPPEAGDNGPLVVGGAYSGVQVPEPSIIIGLGFIAGLGSLIKKSKQSR